MEPLQCVGMTRAATKTCGGLLSSHGRPGPRDLSSREGVDILPARRISPEDVRIDHRLDRAAGRGYIAALAFLALILWALPAAADVVVRGAALPPGSQEVGVDRYRSPSSYTDTLTWFSKRYKGSPRKTIINQPSIRAIHIVNDSGKGSWEGLNVYELDGETRIFVVPKDPPKPGGQESKAK